MARSGEHRPGLPGNAEPPAAKGRTIRATWRGYGIAVLFVGVAVLVREWLLTVVGAQSPFITFYPAVVLAALLGGLGPGLLAMALSAIAASFYWIEPAGHIFIHQPVNALLVTVFLVSCTIITVVCEAIRRARARASASQTQARLAEGLRENEETFRSLFDQAAVPTAVQGTDGRILRANPAYCQYLGYSEEELRDRTIIDITHPEDRAITIPMKQRLLAGAQSIYHDEKRYLRKNGGGCLGRGERLAGSRRAG